MMQYQAQINIAGTPIGVVLVGNRTQGEIVIIKLLNIIGTFFDQPEAEDGIDAVFDDDSFGLKEKSELDYEEFAYNTRYQYKDIPKLLRWLQQQNLQQPV